MSKSYPVPDYLGNLAALDPFERDRRLRRWRSELVKAGALSFLSWVARRFKLLLSAMPSRLRNSAGSP